MTFKICTCNCIRITCNICYCLPVPEVCWIHYIGIMEPAGQTGKQYNVKSIIWVHVIVYVTHVGFLFTVSGFSWWFALLQMFQDTLDGTLDYFIIGFRQLLYDPCHKITCFLSYGANIGADQPKHPCSWISIFVVHSLNSITIHATYILKTLTNLCSRGGWLKSYLVAYPNEMFFHSEAYVYIM